MEMGQGSGFVGATASMGPVAGVTQGTGSDMCCFCGNEVSAEKGHRPCFTGPRANIPCHEWCLEKHNREKAVQTGTNPPEAKGYPLVPKEGGVAGAELVASVQAVETSANPYSVEVLVDAIKRIRFAANMGAGKPDTLDRIIKIADELGIT